MMPLARASSRVSNHQELPLVVSAARPAKIPVSTAETTGPAAATPASSLALRGTREISDTPPSRNSSMRTTPTP